MCTEIFVYLPGSVDVYGDLGLFTWKCGCVLRSGFIYLEVWMCTEIWVYLPGSVGVY